jgi:hypothetical protein
MSVRFEDLIGLHELSGVDRLDTTHKYDDTAQVFRFVLDGKTYAATEDPEDGYRSSMGVFDLINDQVADCFLPVEVMCTVEGANNDDSPCYILIMTDVNSGREVLRVGTENMDDYYPYFVTEWMPQNLFVNRGVSNAQTKIA